MRDFWERAKINGGEIKDGETRCVVFRVDVFTEMVKQLSEATPEQVLESFQAAVKINGSRSLEYYLKMVGDEHVDLLNMVAGTAASLGWGEWFFFIFVEQAKTKRE